MNEKTRKLRYFFSSVAAIFFVVSLYYFITVMLCYFPVGAKIAHGITKEKILSLKIGMDKNQVMNILGDPLYLDNTTGGNYLVYATPGFLGAGVEINLKINNNLLYGIYIEESDLPIYYCDQEKCWGIIKADRFDKHF